MDAMCPWAIDPLVRIWAILHKDLNLEMEAAEARYLQAVMFGLDDELVAGLLGIKLALARRRKEDVGKVTGARIGSDVLYSVQGRPRFARLVHGDVDECGSLGVGTRFGGALLGMTQGMSILWPDERGSLVEVRLLEFTA